MFKKRNYNYYIFYKNVQENESYMNFTKVIKQEKQLKVLYHFTLKKRGRKLQPLEFVGVPSGIRTRVTALKGRCPRPG